MKDYYAVLGVLPSIEPIALEAVWRALLKKYHPDVYKGRKEDADRITKDINEAYEVLRDSAARAEYDRARTAQNGQAGDYEPESQTTGSPTQELERDWRYMTRYHPETDKLRGELAILSASLALTFQATLLQMRSVKKAVELSNGLKQEFLGRYFGDNPRVHRFVEESLKAGRRDVALEVNRAIKILGTPVGDDADQFLQTVMKVTAWSGRASPPTGPSRPATKRYSNPFLVTSAFIFVPLFLFIFAYWLAAWITRD